MPAYNAQKYLPEAIESVLEQTYKDFEFIIIDDCSTDNTWEIIQKYARKDKRIRAFKNKNNLNVVKTRNKAFSKCSKQSAYYAILDADDVCMPQRLEKQVRFLEKNPSYALVGSNLEIIDERSQTIGKRVYPETNKEIQEQMILRNCFAQPAIMIRASIRPRYDEEYTRVQDYELWFRTIQEHKGYNLQEPLIRYRLHTQQGKNKYLRLTLRNTARIQRKYLFTKKYFSPKALINHLLHYVLLLLPKTFVLNQFRKRAIQEQ